MLEEVGATARVRVRATRTQVHSNIAACILFGRERSLSIETSNGAVWGDAILVDPNWAHVVDFHGGIAEVIYLPPHQGRGHGARALPKPALRILEDQIDRWSVNSAADLVDCLGFAEPLSDPAISAIRHRIDFDPMMRLGEIKASRIARLERTTMLRRFKHKTGMTFRAYKNWAALKHAARLIGEGEALGVAGLDAGFADAAHFSRQYRATFGLSPTEGRNCVV